MIWAVVDKMFDEEGAEIVRYALMFIFIWFVMFLALNYLADHLTMFKGRIYDFLIDPAREPLPKQEAVNE